MLILSIFFYPVGLLLGMIYIGVADSLQNGQSVGKKFMGFQVINLEDGTPCSVKQSFIRNLPMIVPLFFAIIPLWGAIFALILGVPLIVFEILMLYKLDSGHRLGDVMADTSVLANTTDRAVSKERKTTWFGEGSQISP
ncbi:RDD family protein [Bacteriovoracaceae bacterium]|nr:RDD family protein [Bacteriovoracaceae bacterium]